MEWNRTNTLPLSRVKCGSCDGSGVYVTGEGKEEPCNCVLRAVFQSCYRRFVECAVKSTSDSRVSLEKGTSHTRSGGWGRKQEEFVADFCLIAKRTLTAEEHTLFRYHFLLGADYILCGRKFGMDKAEFFYNIYKMKAKLGRAFRETQPYPLYPVNEYFEGEWREHAATMPDTVPEMPKRKNPFPWQKRAA
jgi:hypothetical protein